jgi:hypothetical protein
MVTTSENTFVVSFELQRFFGLLKRADGKAIK